MPEATLQVSLDLNPQQVKKLNAIGMDMQKVVKRHFKSMAKPLCDVVAVQLQKNVEQLIPAGGDYPQLAPVSLDMRKAQGIGGRKLRPLKVTGEGAKKWKKVIRATYAKVFNIAETDSGFPYLQAHAEGFKVPVTPKMIAFFAAQFPTVAFSKDQLAKLGGESGNAGGRIAAALKGYRKFPPTKKDKIVVPRRNFYVVTDHMKRAAQAAMERWMGAFLRKITR